LKIQGDAITASAAICVAAATASAFVVGAGEHFLMGGWLMVDGEVDGVIVESVG
jgi:hypothetical protein